jgi:photosystem II stability/assembly factor-like uncharacterized protein
MKKLFFLILTLSFLSNIQAQWVEQTSGVTTALRSVCSTPSTNVAWICGASGVVLKTTNTGANWVSANTGIPNATTLICISAVDANLALVVGYTGSGSSTVAYMYRTSNGGTNWTQVLTEPGFYDAVCMVNANTGFMVGDPVNNRWSLWKTLNGGVNWDSTGLNLPVVHSAEAGWNNAMYVMYPKIWIGTNDTVVLYSSNFGTNWTRYKTTGETNGYSLCFNYMSGQEGLIAGTSAMLQTSNFGANWTNVPIIGSGNVVGITFTPIITDNFLWPAWYVRSSTSSIYKSVNGTSWTVEYTAPAGNYNAISQAIVPRRLWAVRANGGISSCEVFSNVNKIGNVVPSKYELFQNYPNPFNPETNIKFQIPRLGFVSMKVYDALGKEVQTLVNEELKPGFYETKFNAENLSSGIYFYKLITDKFTDVKKMVIVK